MFKGETNRMLQINFKFYQERDLEKRYVSRAKTRIFQDFAEILFMLIVPWLY